MCRDRMCSDLNFFECQSDARCSSVGNITGGNYDFTCYTKGEDAVSLLVV